MQTMELDDTHSLGFGIHSACVLTVMAAFLAGPDAEPSSFRFYAIKVELAFHSRSKQTTNSYYSLHFAETDKSCVSIRVLFTAHCILRP